MKTVLIKIRAPVGGDLVIVQYSSPRGGVTSAKYLVRGDHKLPQKNDAGEIIDLISMPGDDAAAVARELAKQINTDWMPGDGCFRAKVRPDGSLVVNCGDHVDNVAFSGIVEGAGGTAIEIEEF